MLLVDPKEVHKLVADERGGISYSLRVPRLVDRVKYRRAVRKEGGKAWNEINLLDMLSEGVRCILSEPEDEERREEYVNAILEYRQGFIGFAQGVRDGEFSVGEDPVEFIRLAAEKITPPPLIREIERVVTDHYAPYADKLADNEVYHEIAGVVAARMFLVGWEGIDHEFRRTRDGVPDDVLEQIPAGHLVMIAAEIARLMEPEADRLKNLQSPSGGASDQETSQAATTPPQKTRSSKTTANQTSGSSPEPGSPS